MTVRKLDIGEQIGPDDYITAFGNRVYPMLVVPGPTAILAAKVRECPDWPSSWTDYSGQIQKIGQWTCAHYREVELVEIPEYEEV